MSLIDPSSLPRLAASYPRAPQFRDPNAREAYHRRTQTCSVGKQDSKPALRRIGLPTFDPAASTIMPWLRAGASRMQIACRL